MKKIIPLIICLFSLNIVQASEPLLECDPDFTINSNDNCTGKVVASCIFGNHEWAISYNYGPFITLDDTDFMVFINFPCPGEYSIRHRLPGCVPPIKKIIDITITCKDCPIDETEMEGEITFSSELVGSTGTLNDFACDYEFTALNTTCLDIVSYDWSFENGTPSTSTDANPVVQFPDEVASEVCLEVDLGFGCYEEYCETIYPDCEPPCDPAICEPELCTVDFDWEADGCTVTIINESSPAPGSNWSYWKIFVDGIYQIGGLSTFNQQLINLQGPIGIYEVCLEMTDNVAKCTDTHCRYVQVECDPGDLCETFSPTALFDLNVAFEDCFTVILTDQSTSSGWPGCELANWYWDFGNGDYSTDPSPVYTYEENGHYEICLYVDDDCSCIGQYCETITIDCHKPCQAEIGYAKRSCAGVACMSGTGPGGSCDFCIQDFSTPSTCAEIISRHWEVTFPDPSGGITYTEDDVDLIKICSQWFGVQVVVCLTITDSECCESTVCESYVTCSNFNDDDGKAKLSNGSSNGLFNRGGIELFPNPASDLFTVQTGNTEDRIQSVKMLNLQGMVVYQQFDLNANQITMNTFDLAAGVYIVETIVGEERISKKLIISK